MAKHVVNLEIPHFPIGKADLNFKVMKDGQPFGTLKVSHGAVVWVPSKRSTHRRLSWTKLAQIFEAEGTRL